MTRMPTLFLGHGSPMNAIEDNAYTEAIAAFAAEVGRPEAIVCVSAHYMTRGVSVTGAAHPRTIHDFYGFPAELYAVDYPAPGDPALAEKTAALLGADVDGEWGFDHGCWSPIRRMWPEADVPVVEVSLDLTLHPRKHYELGAALAPLRDEGVLIVGSGNIVHNLGAIDWAHPTGGYDWNAQFDGAVAAALAVRDDDVLVDFADLPGARRSVPSLDHYLPLLYAIAAAPAESVHTVYEGLEYGSLSMRCVRVGD